MSTRQENLEAIQHAEEASVILGVLKPHVDSVVGSIVHNMVAHYRGAKLDHDMLVGKVGEISALLGLVNLVEGTIRAGEQAREREFDDGKKEDRRSDYHRGGSRQNGG